MRLIVAAVILMGGFVAMGNPASAAGQEILVAVREDASPFVSVSNDQEPRGFLWEICARAVDQAGYTAKIHPIDAENRNAILQSGSTKDGKTRPDLLCDPTTITISRMRNFDDRDGNAPGLEFSPIVFIANGSYVQQTPPAEPAIGFLKKDDKPGPFCNARVAEILATGLDSNSTASDDARKWWQPSLFPPGPGKPTDNEGAPYAIWGYVEGSTIGDAITNAISQIGDRQIVCKVPFPSHEEAAASFCEGRIFRYFGDVELIRAAIANYFYENGTKNGTKCQADQSAANEGTYEPYAFVLSSTCHPDFPERFTRALYTMFEDQTIDRLFGSHFSGSQKSEYLAILFRINSIPRGNDDAPRPKPPASEETNCPPPPAD